MDSARNAVSSAIFLSTLSLRRATVTRTFGRASRTDFYPRSPCGERRVKSFMRNGFFLISIHALLAESDPRACRAWSRRPYFYPRSPCGERLFVPAHVAVVPSISIHALLAESDGAGREFNVAVLKFLSTLSLRRATSRAPPTVDPLAHFYPRSPCGERPKRIHCA